ncbi:hypothetical protein ACSBR2_013337 [Camellia fascicularis]
MKPLLNKIMLQGTILFWLFPFRSVIDIYLMLHIYCFSLFRFFFFFECYFFCRILKRYQNDPRTMQLVSKHFYSEKVFDDSSTDQPKIRWRYRNFFGDNVANSQRTHGSDSCSDKTDSEKTDMENTDEPKRFSRNSSADAITNPLDCVFGIPASTEEIHHTNTSGTSPKRHGRGHKRSHRRHRMHRHEVSPNFQLS